MIYCNSTCVTVVQTINFDAISLTVIVACHSLSATQAHVILIIYQVGTTAAALRAGIPQVPCPVMLDQPHNAKTIVRLGCAPGYIAYSSASATSLAKLITKVDIFQRNSRSAVAFFAHH